MLSVFTEKQKNSCDGSVPLNGVDSMNSDKKRILIQLISNIAFVPNRIFSSVSRSTQACSRQEFLKYIFSFSSEGLLNRMNHAELTLDITQKENK